VGVDSRGRIKIEFKDDLGKRGLPSPDRADTMAMACSGRAQGGVHVDGSSVTASEVFAGSRFGWVIGDHDETIRLAPPPPWAGTARGPCGGVEQPAAVEVCFEPLLPHRQWYEMGG
jgi:hypothetical protein